MNPIDPAALPPEDGQPKPWHKPQPPATDSGGGDAGSAAGNIAEGLGEIAGGALDAVGSVAEATGGVLDIAGGCLDGCSGCSLAILVTLFAVAGTATAFFR
jgi:hypothetical protein